MSGADEGGASAEGRDSGGEGQPQPPSEWNGWCLGQELRCEGLGGLFDDVAQARFVVGAVVGAGGDDAVLLANAAHVELEALAQSGEAAGGNERNAEGGADLGEAAGVIAIATAEELPLPLEPKHRLEVGGSGDLEAARGELGGEAVFGVAAEGRVDLHEPKARERDRMLRRRSEDG